MLMALNPRSSQRGVTLIGATFFIAVFASILMIIQTLIERQRDRDVIARQGRFMANYINAVAGFMVEQGPPAPDPTTIAGLSGGPGIFVANGTDWLKNTNCGGGFTPGDAFLGCDVPSDFNQFFDLGSPTVTFDYTTASTASIELGIVQDNGPDPIKAGLLVRAINRHIEAAGYQHISVFHRADNTDAELLSANLRAQVDSMAPSDIWLRRDGNNSMTGPIVTEHDDWALIARDDAGNEVENAQDAQASINTNDIFVRSADAWSSETHQLAEDAFALAVRSPQIITETGPSATVSKPNCPGTLNPQIFATPVVFVGGDGSDTRLIAGVRRRVTDTGSSWDVSIEVFYDDGTNSGSGWQPAPTNFGRLKVTLKCT